MDILKALDMRLFGGGEIEIVDSIPKMYTHHRLPMAAEGALLSPVVTALYQHIPGDGFDIWVGDYLAHRKGSVRTRAAVETVELSIAWMNKFAYRWKGIGTSDTTSMLFRLSYACYIDITTKFDKDSAYKTIDFHFSKPMFERYAKDFPKLHDFLDKLHDQKNVSIDAERKVSVSMRGVIESLMNLHCSPVNRMHILKNKAEDMLMYALEAIQDDPEIKINPISKMMKQKINRAAEILDLSIIRPPTVIELSEKVECSARSLQTGFKKCFGTTVYEYSRVRKLELAKVLLIQTNDGLHEIADQVGYNDGAYLGNAFKKKFGMTPEAFRADVKRRNR